MLYKSFSLIFKIKKSFNHKGNICIFKLFIINVKQCLKIRYMNAMAIFTHRVKSNPLVDLTFCAL